MNDAGQEDLDELSWLAAREVYSRRSSQGTLPHVPTHTALAKPEVRSALKLMNALSSQVTVSEEARSKAPPWADLLDSVEGRLRISADLLGLVTEGVGDPASEITTAPAIQRVILRVVDALIDSRRLGEAVTVLDIACGSGLLLARVAESLESATERPTHAYGSDVNADVVSLAQMVFAIAGSEVHLTVSDVLQEDAFPQAAADFVVSDLPLNLVLGREVEPDSRFPLGVPRRNATLALLQAMLSKLRPADEGGGIAVALVANAVLLSGDELSTRFRTSVVDQDVLRAVVLLPERLMRTTGVPVNLLVFDNAKPKAWQGMVQFIDLRSQFIDSDQLRGQRSISADGLEELERALRRPKPSRNVRTVPHEDLRFRDVRVGFTPDPGASQTTFNVRVPTSADADEWCRPRYGNGDHLSVVSSGAPYASWDPEPVFRDALLDKALKPQKERWEFRSLVGLVADFRLLPSLRSRDRAEWESYRMDSGRPLVIPLAASGQARVLQAGDDLPEEQALLVGCDAVLDPEFIAGWLNTEVGRTARRSAENSRRYINVVRSDSDALRYLDRLQVPVPEVPEQQSLAAVLSMLNAARSEVDLLQAQLWDSPQTGADIRDQMGIWLNRSERLDSWIDSLPFPLASSMWTYVSVRSQKESVEQLIHVFEAFSQFHATHMIAALRQDPSLWKSVLPRLRTLHRDQHLSFATATFATWRSTSELVAAEFRRGVNSDDDEQKGRYLALLGDPSPAGLERLLGPDLSEVLGKVNALRNKWQGHGGAVSPREAQERHERLREHLIELRSALGYGWGGLRLIRAGSSTFDGTGYRYEVELLQGVRTPFEPSHIDTDRPLVRDGLYLVSQAGGCLEVPGFVRMGPDPEATENTCYFYNRLEDSGAVRVVTYQRAEVGEMERTDAQLSRLVAELDARSE